MNYRIYRERGGFTPAIALILMGYLGVVSAWVMTLVLQERNLSRALFTGVSNYVAAEGAAEYAFLKIKNHLSGFSDSVTDDDTDSLLMGSGRHIPRIGYTLEAASTQWASAIGTGTSGFEIIPLFIDTGALIQSYSKNPDTSSVRLISTSDLTFSGSNEFVWNIIGNRSVTDIFNVTQTVTEGISWTGTHLSRMSEGETRNIIVDANTSLGEDTLSITWQTIGNFIDTHSENFLIIYNPAPTSLTYSMTAVPSASLPKATLQIEARTGQYRQQLVITENRSALFDELKYSLLSN